MGGSLIKSSTNKRIAQSTTKREEMSKNKSSTTGRRKISSRTDRYTDRQPRKRRLKNKMEEKKEVKGARKGSNNSRRKEIKIQVPITNLLLIRKIAICLHPSQTFELNFFQSNFTSNYLNLNSNVYYL